MVAGEATGQIPPYRRESEHPISNGPFHSCGGKEGGRPDMVPARSGTQYSGRFLTSVLLPGFEEQAVSIVDYSLLES